MGKKEKDLNIRTNSILFLNVVVQLKKDLRKNIAVINAAATVNPLAKI
ncbi:hypothetical protein [Halobacillus sp. Marseille-Q1614]|nr:hypothetical protein [Halobacillus sp. Marseille-Q1614]